MKALGPNTVTIQTINGIDVETAPQDNSEKSPVIKARSDAKEDLTKAPLQQNQASVVEVQRDYLEHLESRLSMLEERFTAIQSFPKVEVGLKPKPKHGVKEEVDYDSSSETEASEYRKPARIPAMSEVRTVNFSDFKNRYCEEDSRYAIEVLLAGHNLEEIWTEQTIINTYRSNPILSPNKAKLIAQPKRSAEAETEERWPRRVRIRSLPILAILRKIVGESWASKPRTFFRPFKTIIYFHEKMKEALRELESKWGELERQESASVKNSSDTVTKQDDTKTMQTTEEMSCSSLKKDINSDSKIADREGSGLADQNFEGSSAHNDDIEETLDPLLDSPEALRDMRCYVNFIDKKIIPLYHQFDGCQSNSRPKVRFDDLSNSGDDSDDGDDGGKLTTFKVRCYYIDYSGASFGAVRKKFIVPYFEGERDILSLEIYPFRFARNHDRIWKELKERGEIFQDYSAAKHLYYNGVTIARNPGETERVRRYSVEEPRPIKAEREHLEYVDSDIIVDFFEAFQVHPEWRPKLHVPLQVDEDYSSKLDNVLINQWSDKDRKRLDSEIAEHVQVTEGVTMRERNENLRRDKFLISCTHQQGMNKNIEKQDLREEDLVLLPKRLFAYVLRNRKFFQIDIRYSSLVVEQKTAFESLKLPGNHKNMVQALVDSHFVKKGIEKVHYADSLDQDVIQGKGRGIVILLHGVPGVGKTSTAEGVAKANKKPLFTITCGDLGFTPSDVESALNEIFRLAHL
ncbi:MAG: hypothetical protein M1834_009557 [Cirrosporium novae-zelandiae]|nr:MAG: hypothetical protein M1834_009557 [Cirrosporium novae-zelandiae]